MNVMTCSEMITSSELAEVVLLGLTYMCDAVFQRGATCYQASSVPWDAGILEHHQLRMLTIQVKPFLLPVMYVSPTCKVLKMSDRRMKVKLPSDHHNKHHPCYVLCIC